MSLVALAEKDLVAIMVDKSGGMDIEVINPEGVNATLQGFSNDISQVIDPETGAIVSGRAASVALPISELYKNKFELPRGISDNKAHPWVVKLTSIAGELITFRVVQSNPDRTVGMITLILELYDDTDANKQARHCRNC